MIVGHWYKAIRRCDRLRRQVGVGGVSQLALRHRDGHAMTDLRTRPPIYGALDLGHLADVTLTPSVMFFVLSLFIFYAAVSGRSTPISTNVNYDKWERDTRLRFFFVRWTLTR